MAYRTLEWLPRIRQTRPWKSLARSEERVAAFKSGSSTNRTLRWQTAYPEKLSCAPKSLGERHPDIIKCLRQRSLRRVISGFIREIGGTKMLMDISILSIERKIPSVGAAKIFRHLKLSKLSLRMRPWLRLR